MSKNCQENMEKNNKQCLAGGNAYTTSYQEKKKQQKPKTKKPLPLYNSATI